MLRLRVGKGGPGAAELVLAMIRRAYRVELRGAKIRWARRMQCVVVPKARGRLCPPYRVTDAINPLILIRFLLDYVGKVRRTAISIRSCRASSFCPSSSLHARLLRSALVRAR